MFLGLRLKFFLSAHFSLLASQGPVVLGFRAAVVVLPPPYSSADFIFIFLCWVLVQGLCSSRLRQSLSPQRAGCSRAARNHFSAPWFLPPFSSCRRLIFLPQESLLSSSVSPLSLVRQEYWACYSRVKVKSCAYSLISLIILFLAVAISSSAPGAPS
jgi:hypothetical protein